MANHREQGDLAKSEYLAIKNRFETSIQSLWQLRSARCSMNIRYLLSTLDEEGGEAIHSGYRRNVSAKAADRACLVISEEFGD